MRRTAGFLIILFSGLFLNFTVFCQQVQTPVNQDYQHKVERFEIRSGKLSNQLHTTIRPFERQGIIQLISRYDSSGSHLELSPTDRWNVQYLKSDNWEYLPDGTIPSVSNKKPIFRYIYRKKADFFNAHTKDYDIHASPILHLAGGQDRFDGKNETQLINTRGVEIRGSLNQKLGFYTMFTENQATTPHYIRNYALTMQGFPYQSFTKVLNDDSLAMKTDYMMAIGYVVFNPIKNLSLQFGHDKTFIGPGVRSMILSDFSAPYLSLKARARIGRMEYLAVTGQMSNLQVPRPATSKVPVPPKFMAFHHLNFNVTRNLNFGLFETVFFGPRDKTGFDFNYLNPVIFYRFVEGFLGSADNAIVGIDFKLNLFRTASFYGQLALDEFNLTENRKKGWWAKKYAGQLGVKYIDVLGIRNLDLQVEGNFARPYVYSHLDISSNTANYNVPAAHPMGANFAEVISILRYQPFGPLQLRLTYMNAIKGEDGPDGFNWGGNIKKIYTENRPMEYGNYIGQGYTNRIHLLDLNASYMVFHNFFVDASYLWRRASLDGGRAEGLAKMGIRWNLPENFNFF